MKRMDDHPKRKGKYALDSSDYDSPRRGDSDDEFEEKVQKAPPKVKR